MNLLGAHDREAANFSPPGTWILDTIALSDNPTPPRYDSNHSWIVRVNWGYEPQGTIPLDPTDQNLFIERLVSYVKRSQNVSRWIIGNEPNLPREWPHGKPIYPNLYADFFRRCRDAVYEAVGAKNKFLIAAAGPWNDQLKYTGNSKGDWIANFIDTIAALKGEFDGFSIHSYTHGYTVALVTAQTFMDNPFQNRHYDFQTYHDFLNAIPDSFSDLEIHLTEANGGKFWQAVGLIPAMAADIDAYNRGATRRKIKSFIIYRYPHYDDYWFQGISPVEQEYLATVAKNFQSQTAPVGSSTGPTVPNPPIVVPPPIPEKLVPGKPVAIIQATILNVRDKPGTAGSKIVGTKKMGDKISVLAEREVDGHWWYQIGPDQWAISEWTNRPHAAQLSDWQRAKQFTSGWEGTFQNLNWDPGNWTGCAVGKGKLVGTNFGVSACSYPNLDIKSLTKEKADEIFYRDYWLKTGCDKLAWPMNLIVYDTAVNFGTTIASYYLDQSEGDPLKYIGLRLKGYRHSEAWPQAHDAWIDRVIDLIGEVNTK